MTAQMDITIKSTNKCLRLVELFGSGNSEVDGRLPEKRGGCGVEGESRDRHASGHRKHLRNGLAANQCPLSMLAFPEF